MSLEDLIYRRLMTSTNVTGKLAKFNKKAAIFYQNAPDDTDPGWEKKMQYPRIDFVLDTQSDKARSTAGQISLNIWCDESGTPPEAIEPWIKAALCDVFMTPQGERSSCLSWNRSEAFDALKSESQGQLTGISVYFDVLAFPKQDTSDPDPIYAINNYAKAWEQTSTIIGLDRMPEYFTVDSAPAFYFRLSSLEKESETNSVVWMTASIAGHVFAQSTERRLQWLKALVDRIAECGEITMADESPMQILNIRADSAIDYLATGQLLLSVRFGIFRKPERKTLLASASRSTAY